MWPAEEAAEEAEEAAVKVAEEAAADNCLVHTEKHLHFV